MSALSRLGYRPCRPGVGLRVARDAAKLWKSLGPLIQNRVKEFSQSRRVQRRVWHYHVSHIAHYGKDAQVIIKQNTRHRHGHVHFIFVSFGLLSRPQHDEFSRKRRSQAAHKPGR
jgi:hypothetical protein